MSHTTIIDLARAIGTARHLQGPCRQAARRAALRDLCRGARAEMGIPVEFVVSRPEACLPEDLDEAEVVAYDLVVRLAALASRSNPDLAEHHAAGLLCGLIALESSPALATAGTGGTGD